MSSSRDALMDALSANTQERPSMDILLQLTLPIVLILALIMSVEVNDFVAELAQLEAENQELQQQKDVAEADQRSMREDFERSATGELVKELERMVLTIQQQLLLKAAAEVMAQQRATLALDSYAAATPTPTELASGRIQPQFRESTAAVAAMLDGQTALSGSRVRAAEQVEVRFAELATAYLNENSHMRRRTTALHAIEPDNRVAFETVIEGHLSGFRTTVFDAQMALITTWLQDSATLDSLATSSEVAALWRSIQTASGQNLEVLLERFANLKVREALDAAGHANIVLLDGVKVAAMRNADP